MSGRRSAAKAAKKDAMQKSDARQSGARGRGRGRTQERRAQAVEKKLLDRVAEKMEYFKSAERAERATRDTSDQALEASAELPVSAGASKRPRLVDRDTDGPDSQPDTATVQLESTTPNASGNIDFRTARYQAESEERLLALRLKVAESERMTAEAQLRLQIGSREQASLPALNRDMPAKSLREPTRHHVAIDMDMYR